MLSAPNCRRHSARLARSLRRRASKTRGARPEAERRNQYFDLAGALRPELERIDGFTSIERFESLTEPRTPLSDVEPANGPSAEILGYLGGARSQEVWHR